MKILQPLEIATTLFSYDEHVSLSNVLPVLHSLVETLDKPLESNCRILWNPNVPDNEDIDDDRDIGELPAVCDCQTIIKEDVKTRWNLDNLKLDSFLVLSTALDPQYKSMNFLSADQKKSLDDIILDRIISLQPAIEPRAIEPHDDECSLEEPPSKKQKLTALEILLGPDEGEDFDDHISPIEELK